jgi:hypothetical protein
MKSLPLIAALGAVCSLAMLPATASMAATAASSPASYHGTPGAAKQLTQAASVSSLPKVASAFRNEGPRALTPLGLGRPSAIGASAAPADSAAAVSDDVSRSGLIAAFNGLSDLNSDNLNGFPITPPDQGLCIGRDSTLAGSPKAVWEPINLAARETTPGGTLLRPDVSLATLFQDPYAEGDVRCLYDAATQSFYFTEIGFPVAAGPAADDNNTTADVVVMNRHGVAAYQFDTSLGGPSAADCFGDQPKAGFDNNALVISTDEYCGPTESNYEGAIALVISKPELVAEAATVRDSVVGPVSLAGNPVVGMDPAIGTGSSTGYLVNSVPFLANGNNNPVGNTVGLWTLTGSASVTTGHGTVTLTGKVLPTEPYAFPVPATSTGNGSATAVNGSVVTSETALNPDDSRLSGPVEVTRGIFGQVQLWTALDAAVSPDGQAARDAGAWFEIDATRQHVARQGYVAARNANLLYPAIGAPQFGSPEMVFTITSATINPSAAYTRLGSGQITTVAAGAGPHLSFSDAPPFNSARWGDYSFAQPDPDGHGVWMATEYIPPAADQDPQDNWGTYVFEVPGL